MHRFNYSGLSPINPIIKIAHHYHAVTHLLFRNNLVCFTFFNSLLASLYLFYYYVEILVSFVNIVLAVGQMTTNETNLSKTHVHRNRTSTLIRQVLLEAKRYIHTANICYDICNTDMREYYEVCCL